MVGNITAWLVGVPLVFGLLLALVCRIRIRKLTEASGFAYTDSPTPRQTVKGEARNEKDGLLRGIKDAKARESVIVDFAAIKDSKAGELAAKFDIVMGFSPTDMGH